MTLQEQINAAVSGAVITLPDGSEHVGNFVVNKSLTIQGKAKIRTPNADPAIRIPPKTGPVVLKGLEATTTVGWLQVYDVIRFGDWQTSLLADVPQGLTIEDCDIHGQPGQKVQRGIAANGANFVLKNSKVREIHEKGADAQAVCAWNGPGPFKIFDSYLEASGENVMFGGADARIPNLVPSDIEIRRCHFFKPLAWKGVWSVKNLLEFKNARRFVVDGCTLENNWVDAQSGASVLFTVRNQDGGNPWAVVEDGVFSNNVIKNVPAGFYFLGRDYNHPSLQSSRVAIKNVLVEFGTGLGSNGRLVQLQEFNSVTIDRLESNPPHTFLVLSGQPVSELVYRNSLLGYGQYGLFGDAGKPFTYYAPDGQFQGNVVYGPSIPASQQIAGNTYLTAKPSPAPSGAGVDMAALLAAQGGTAPAPTPQPAPLPTPTPAPVPPPVPAPPCTMSVPDSVAIPKNGSGVISVNVSNLTGPVTVTHQGSDGQVMVTPLSRTAFATSNVLAFQVRVKKQSRTITFQSPCGSKTVKVVVQ